MGADGAAQPLHQAAKALDEHLLLGGHAAADAERGVNGVVPGGEDTQVQGGLHQAGHIGAHGLDAVGQAGEHTHHAAAGAFIQGQQVGFRRADGDGDGRVVDPVFLFEGGVHFGADGLDGAGVGGHQGHGGGGNGVVLQAAADGDHPQGRFLLQGVQDPAQQHAAVGAALVDLRAGVTAHQAGDGDLLHRGAEGTAGHGQAAVGPGAAGAADGENALVLGVHVQHPAALENGHVQALGAVHTGFLVHGEDGLDGRVGQGIIVQYGHGHGHCNATAWVLIGGQIIVQVDLFHVKFSYYGTPPVAYGDSPLGEGASRLPP